MAYLNGHDTTNLRRSRTPYPESTWRDSLFHLATQSYLLAQETGSGSSAVSLIVTLALVGGVMWFFFIMPQRRRQRTMTDLRSSLEVGDEVRTAGGIVGTIRGFDEGDLKLEVDAGTTITIAKNAIIERLGADEA